MYFIVMLVWAPNTLTHTFNATRRRINKMLIILTNTRGFHHHYTHTYEHIFLARVCIAIFLDNILNALNVMTATVSRVVHSIRCLDNKRTVLVRSRLVAHTSLRSRPRIYCVLVCVCVSVFICAAIIKTLYFLISRSA